MAAKAWHLEKSEMKEVYIYGAHVKVGYTKKYDRFEEIAHEGMEKSKTGIWDLVHDKPKQKFEWVDVGALKHVPYGMGDRNLVGYAECRRGKPKFRGIPGIVGYELWDRLMLMNDEVMWQWKTGSDLVYRFDDLIEALDFYEWVLDGVIGDVIEHLVEKELVTKFCVGDRVELLEDIEYNLSYDLDPESRMLALTQQGLPRCAEILKHVKLSKGEVVRVFNVDMNGFSISPIDGVTAFRVPGTGGAKIVVGTQKAISWAKAKLVKSV